MSFPGGYHKIKLIKIVRERTGCGLKEAKDAVKQANGDLDLAVRITFQSRRLPQSNGVGIIRAQCPAPSEVLF